MNNSLIIFVDGFPNQFLDRLDHKGKFPYSSALMPTIGYSINIHAELFAGLTADEAGFFNTWKYEPENSPFRRLRRAKSMLRDLGGNRYSNRILRDLIALICGSDSLNIPYELIDMFTPCGQSIFSKDFPHSKLIPEDVSEGEVFYGKDYTRYIEAIKEIGKKSSVFVAFVELDGISHKFGLNSNQYSNCLSSLNSWINDIHNKFREANPDGNIVVLSDHGMSAVKRAVHFDPETELGSVDGRDFIYFLDTTMLRLWYLKPASKSAVESQLSQKDYGRIVTEGERLDYGITDSRWAETLFILNEGCVFDPSFLEKGHPLAMHGYHPSLPWQKGIFLYSGPKVFPARETITAKECYTMLKEIGRDG